MVPGVKLVRLGMARRGEVDRLREGSVVVLDLRDRTVEVSALVDGHTHVPMKGKDVGSNRIVGRGEAACRSGLRPLGCPCRTSPAPTCAAA